MDEFETLLINLEPRIGAAGMAAMRNMRKELALTQDEANQTAQILGVTLPNAIDKLSRTGRSGATGTNMLRSSLAQLAITATGTTGPIGRVVEGLLLLGAGSGLVTGVAAGVAIIAAAMKLLSTNSDEAAKAAEVLVKHYQDLVGVTQQKSIDQAQQQLDALIQKEAALKSQILTAQELAEIRQTSPEGADIAAQNAVDAQQQLTALLKKEDELRTALGLARAEQADFLRSIADDARESGETLEQFEKRMALLAEKSRQAANQAATGLAELAGDPLAKKIAELDQAISNILHTQAELGNKAPASLQPWIAKLEQVRTLAASVQKSFTVIVDALPNEPLPGQSGIPVILRGTGNLAAPNRPNTGEIDEEKTKLQLLQAQQQVLAEQSNQIADAARGALQLADAFGGVGTKTATILEDIITIATKIPELVKGIQVLSAGGGVAGAISGGLAVLGALASLIGTLFGGTSPEEQARQEALQKNSEQLQHLSLVVGNLANGITGDQFARVGAFLDKTHSVDPVNRPVSIEDVLKNTLIPPSLKADIIAVAQALGIDLKGSIDQLNEAVKDNEIGRLADTFAGASSVTASRLTLNNVKDPQAILTAAIKDAGRFSPALQGLEGLDLTTSAGRASAKDILNSILDEISNGKGISADELGGLTADQLLEAVTNIGDLLNQANAQGQVGGQTEQFGVSQTITVAQASEILAFLSTANVFAEQTAQNTGVLVDLVAQLVTQGGGVAAVPQSAAASRAQGDYASQRALALGNVRIA